jgi:SecD/SecF fusion protein
MQNRSAILIFTILLALACLYQLSFSYFTSSFEGKAKAFAEFKRDSVLQVAGDTTKSKDELFTYYESQYMREHGDEKLFPIFGDSYYDCDSKEIKKGLDLEGGMSVTLEVSVPDMVINLADNNKSENFRTAIDRAKALQAASTDNFITLFGKAWSEKNESGKLWQVFHNRDNKAKFPANSSDEEILNILNEEADAAVSNTEKIIRTRIDRFGVTQPTIQRQQFSDRILVELPGAKDKERIRKLLKSTANLEFWEVYSNFELGNTLFEADQKLSETLYPELADVDSLATDTAAAAIDATVDTTLTNENDEIEDLLSGEDSAAAEPEELSDAERRKRSPLGTILRPNVGQTEAGGYQFMQGAELGYASKEDTAGVNRLLANSALKDLLPPSEKIKFSWSAKAFDNGFHALYGLKITTRNGKARLDGNAIVDARQDYRQMNGQVIVLMQMDSEGAKVWKNMTAEAAATNPKSQIAIVLDNQVYSAPSVNEEIPSGNSEISVGGDNQEDALREGIDLANLLKAGALPAPANIVDEQIIGPSLGRENIQKGVMSFLLALVVILIYMVFYYRGAGLVSNVALIANMFFLFGALASLGASLTLPGIAGIILTIGMAVDANVLIFERIKEELRSGAGLGAAINKGYEKAYSAIIDANITTLLTALILFFFGTGPIKGFATTLIIGIITSLFTAIFLTRIIFSYRLDKKLPISFYTTFTQNWFSNTNFNWVGNRKKFYIFSSIIVIGGMASLFTRGMDLGVDFSGGRTYEITFDEKVNTQDVRDALSGAFVADNGEKGSAEVKAIGTAGEKVKITTDFLIDSNEEGVDMRVDNALIAALDKVGGFDAGSMESKKVAPTISDDFKDSSYKAILLALLVIFLYIAFRFKKWQFGASALIAMAHDVLLVLGIFSLLKGMLPFTLEVDQAFIAAILTVVGYSINDTVIVFDRVREYLAEHKSGGRAAIINSALNSTLSRTFNTSMTTIVVLFMMFLFGSDSIKGFTFALMIGVIVGTYSSLCVATPMVVDLTKEETL